MVQKAHLRANASAATRAEAKEAARQALLAAFNDADPKERETIAAMVAVGVESALDSAQRNFKKTPGGEYWKALEDAMWAWQYWQGQVGADRLLTAFEMRDIGIGSWMKHLSLLGQRSLG